MADAGLAVDYCSALFFFFSSRRRHTRFDCDWSSDVCSSDLELQQRGRALAWHRAAALLQLTERLPTAGRGDWRERAHALLGEATRLAERARSEERRVGEEGRSRWAPDHLKKKKR